MNDLQPVEKSAASASASTATQREDEFRKQVLLHLPRNFTAHLIHGLLGQTGFRLIQAPTFLPAYVFLLSGSTTMVGLARTCQAVGMFLTPVFGATLIERRLKVLPMVFATGMAMRLSVFGLGLAGFLFAKEANLWAICILLGLQGIFTGMQTVTFSFLVSKVIPVEKRGAVGGLRNTLANLVSMVAGVIGGYLVSHNTWGNGYACVFLVAFALATSGLLALTLVREPESPGVKAQQKFGSRLREVPALLRSDVDYRGYVWARAIGAAGRMAVPFYFVYAAQQAVLPPESIGFAHTAWVAGQTGSTLLWGLLGDKRGFRDVLALSLLSWAAATIALMYGHGMLALLLSFAGVGIGQGGFEMSCTNLVLEFGPREDVPMRIAVAQSAEQLVQIVAPLLGGILVEVASFRAMFWLAAVLQLIALVITLMKVTDPRRRARPAAPHPA